MMNSRGRKTCTLLLIALAFLPSSISEAEPTEAEYLILFEDPKFSPEYAEALITRAGGRLLWNHLEIGLVIAASNNPRFPDRIRRSPPVAGVQKDVKLRSRQPGWKAEEPEEPFEIFHVPVDRVAAVGSMVTDPTQATLFGLQWNLPKMLAPEVWADGHLGDPAVTVAVLDTGIDPTHVELQGRVDLERSVSFVPEDDALLEELFPGAHPVTDLNLHGTLSAAMIGCNAVGTACVAPNVNLVGVKVLDVNYEGTAGRFVTGILYATAIGADVISIGYNLNPPLSSENPAERVALKALELAIRLAKARGAIVIAEAGIDQSIPRSPVDADNNGSALILPAEAGAVVVSASSIDDEFSNFNAFGLSLIDITAPGGKDPVGSINDVVIGPCSRFTQTPLLRDLCATEPGEPAVYISILGTPPATAEVAGLAALIDSTAGGKLRGSEIQDRIFSTVDDIGEPGFDRFFGRGRINAQRALNE